MALSFIIASLDVDLNFVFLCGFLEFTC
jgi:hypothetical protein